VPASVEIAVISAGSMRAHSSQAVSRANTVTVLTMQDARRAASPTNE